METVGSKDRLEKIGERSWNHGERTTLLQERGAEKWSEWKLRSKAGSRELYFL